MKRSNGKRQRAEKSVGKPRAVDVVSAKGDAASGDGLESVSMDGDLWFSHATIATLLQTTTQNVVIHIRDLRLTDAGPVEREIPITKVEGARVVRRSLRHVSLATALAIALRARRFAEHRSLTLLAEKHGIQVSEIRINAVKERDFGQMLEGILEGVTRVDRQYRVGRYRIDFFVSELNLAVEYDESHHQSPTRVSADAKRQIEIAQRAGFEFLRVRQGAEISGLNEILKCLLHARMGTNRS